jgi:putative oxidoreductase
VAASIRWCNGTMQRYFSSFPDSWPGFALLNLRILLACYAFSDFTHLPAFPMVVAAAASGALVLLGGAFLIGLWTPVCALALALVECAEAFGGPWDVHGVRVVVALSVAMLGPGAWSLDARLYGRKVITVTDPND